MRAVWARAMTRAAETALRLAADETAYPQHFAEGLTPWKVAKYYLPAWSGGGGTYDDDLPPPPATDEEIALVGAVRLAELDASGTASSLSVFPAADLPLLAKETGANLVIINNEPTQMDHLSDLVINRDISETLSEISL